MSKRCQGRGESCVISFTIQASRQIRSNKDNLWEVVQTQLKFMVQYQFICVLFTQPLVFWLCLACGSQFSLSRVLIKISSVFFLMLAESHLMNEWPRRRKRGDGWTNVRLTISSDYIVHHLLLLWCCCSTMFRQFDHLLPKLMMPPFPYLSWPPFKFLTLLLQKKHDRWIFETLTSYILC